MMDENTIRAEFEAWASNPDRHGKIPIKAHANGAYQDSRTYSAWYGWLSSRKAIAVPDAIPAAYAIYADNGNMRIWTTEQPHLKRMAEELGTTVVKLYTTPQPTPPAWMPIETAPKNMDCIDIWSSRLGRVTDCVWNQTTYGKKIGFVYQSDYDCDGPVFELVPDPTHWMPLPDAPVCLK